MPGCWLDEWTQEGEFLYRRIVRFPGLGVRPWAPPFGPEPRQAGRTAEAAEFCFYDTETTGLSGGAGTLVFLVGTGWCEGDDLVVEQFFLSDFPGEQLLLQAVRGCFSRFAAFVSYNGRAFDSKLLTTRFLMNGMSFEPGPQVDLLFHARRLWRPIAGDCSLRSIEGKILGVARERDVPGEEVPLIYFDFLKTGKPGLLPEVFEHNLSDITSLARMYAAIARLLDGDLDAVPVDERALGRWMLSKRAHSGLAILAGSFSRGNLEAGVELSLHHKRQGEWERAVEIWQAMVERGRSVFAAIELAKYLEHRAHDAGQALAVIERLLSWSLPASARLRGDIRLRRERLLRKSAARRPRPTARSS
jgi:hypothetical protein